jgi:phosphate/sulfate permease
MDPTLLSVIALIGVALIFDYINGFHDAANSIATVVSTRVLTPGQAVLWARCSISSLRSPSGPPSPAPSARA